MLFAVCLFNCVFLSLWDVLSIFSEKNPQNLICSVPVILNSTQTAFSSVFLAQGPCHFPCLCIGLRLRFLIKRRQGLSSEDVCCFFTEQCRSLGGKINCKHFTDLDFCPYWQSFILWFLESLLVAMGTAIGPAVLHICKKERKKCVKCQMANFGEVF